MDTSNDIATILEDAQWLAHRFDYHGNAVRFLHVPRAIHEDVIFATDEYFPQNLAMATIPLAEIDDADTPDAPIHFIFHSAFCCSTLIAKAFSYPRIATALKEPTILNDLVGFGLRETGKERRDQAMHRALALLARPFAPNESIIVKPSSIVNGLSGDILDCRPESRALLLYAPLSVFLGSIARKGLWGRLWGRDLFAGLRAQNIVHLGFSDEGFFRQSDLQIAAGAWLSQHKLFADLVRRYGKDRVRTIDSETMMASPMKSVSALSTLFEINMPDAVAEEIVAGPVFNSHSKLGIDFDASVRDSERADGDAAYADEIEKVTIWATQVAEAQGISINLDSPLFG